MAPRHLRICKKLPRTSISRSCSEGCFMDSWYVSLVPASVAVAIIGYSFWVAYA